MGMGTWGLSAHKIKKNDLKKICPDTLAALEAFLEEYSIEWDTYHQWAWEGADEPFFFETCFEDDDDEFNMAYGALNTLKEELEKDFNEKTNMSLYSIFRSEDTGDRYDDLDGGAFAVEGVLVISPEAKAMEEQFGVKTEETNWTCWG